MRKFSAAAAAALVLAATASATAEANDRSVRAVMIPPMACQPSRNSGAELALTSWIARAGASADLVCPVPFNNIELGTTSSDNDMTSFRIHYSDSDGTGDASTVSVSRRRSSSSWFLRSRPARENSTSSSLRARRSDMRLKEAISARNSSLLVGKSTRTPR